jgi:predicted glycoside hydrolase/deacetylase ChbG (UPF0249 family)
MSGGPTPLVVNADDLGLTRGVNRAVARAHREGVVSSTSLLAVGSAFDDAVEMLRSHPGLDVGAHLAIVGEDPPLLDPARVPTLLDRHGHFPRSYRTVVARAAAGRIDPDDIRRELRAQLDRLLESGLTVSHLDTHQHLHLWPLVGDVVADLALESGVRWVRLPTSRSRWPVGVAVRRLSARLARKLDGSGLRHPGGYAGLDEAGRMRPAAFAAALAAVAGGDPAEINVHPGEASDPDLARFRWGYAWGDELRMLTDPGTKAAVVAHDMRLTSFAALAGGLP